MAPFLKGFMQEDAPRVKNSASAELTTRPTDALIMPSAAAPRGPAPHPSGHRLLSLYCCFAFLSNRYVKQCKELNYVYHISADGVNTNFLTIFPGTAFMSAVPDFIWISAVFQCLSRCHMILWR